MLTEQEVNKIFSWLPYRDSWIVDRNQIYNNINAYYGDLISKLTQNSLFDTYYSEDGGLGNYLEFMCYPKGQDTYRGNAIIVCISLCAPIAAYGQTTFSKTPDSTSWGGLFSVDEIGNITDTSLTNIEKEIKSLLLHHNLTLLDKEFASKKLPDEVIEAMRHENHNDGDQYLQGIFQKTD
ncbi:MAG TPA: hypothetical protein PLU37_03175 [Chitinophagaceae bacterium]|nr:hypothetical protein [Chitinophagaceae bacterium]